MTAFTIPVVLSQAWKLLCLSNSQIWKIQLLLNIWRTYRKEEWNNHENPFVCVVTGGERKDKEQYCFVSLEHKIKVALKIQK